MGKIIILLLVVCMLIGASVSEPLMVTESGPKSFAMQGSSSSGSSGSSGGSSGGSSSGSSGSSSGGSQTSSG